MQYRQPMQICLSTSTMPSARLNEAPVGHTSIQGAYRQIQGIAGLSVFQANLAYPLCIGFWTVNCTQAVFPVAGAHTDVAVGITTVGID